MFHTEIIEKIKIHFFFQNLLSENLAIYQKMSEDTGDPDRPLM